MIEAYCGRPGAGKTYSMVARALKQVGKRPIFSNMAVDWAQPINCWEELVGCSNGLVLIDEAPLWFDARQFNKLPFEVRSFFAQSRKQGIDMWFTAQSFEGVDVALRRLCAIIWQCQRYGPYVFSTGNDPDVSSGKGRVFARRIVRIKKAICERYDTFQVVADGEGRGGSVGAAGLAQVRMLMKYIWVRDETLGQVRYSQASSDDLLSGEELIECVPGRPWRMVDQARRRYIESALLGNNDAAGGSSVANPFLEYVENVS